MKIIFYTVILLAAAAANLFAQQSLQEQISAVNQEQNRQKAIEMEMNRIKLEEAEKKARQIEAREKEIAARKAKEKARIEAANAEKRKEKLADRKRDQGYEDELRKLDIEEKKLMLVEKKAKADRANEYIDQDLRQKSATTDVIQSTADANRNVSEGAKELLKSEGKAREKEASNFLK